MPTEMTEDTPSTSQQDGSAVAAVRGGDTERYRELVERHERRVFAVVWSRLGDAALAEKATQEAFIRAYRRLWLLADGAKFSGWVSTIAAFESLRILGALDRVKDLEQWTFRPLRRGVAENQLTGGDVEAWVCQQRLAKILRERKEHPQAPVGSLLPPAAN